MLAESATIASRKGRNSELANGPVASSHSAVGQFLHIYRKRMRTQPRPAPFMLEEL